MRRFTRKKQPRPIRSACFSKRLDSRRVQQALEELPAEFREAIVLREMEGLSYKEIGDIAGVPIGTVMSRLARARKRLQQTLAEPLGKEA